MDRLTKRGGHHHPTSKQTNTRTFVDQVTNSLLGIEAADKETEGDNTGKEKNCKAGSKRGV